MQGIRFDYENVKNFITEEELAEMGAQAVKKREVLVKGEGEGNDYIGWVDLPVNYDKEEFVRIEKAAKKIQSDSEVLIVIGIGGSYLGARAAIEFLMKEGSNTKVVYAGNNMSTTYLKKSLPRLKVKIFPSMLFQNQEQQRNRQLLSNLKNILEQKYGKTEAAERIMQLRTSQKEH
jgi:glucose-6-phosphate isomerase